MKNEIKEKKYEKKEKQHFFQIRFTWIRTGLNVLRNDVLHHMETIIIKDTVTPILKGCQIHIPIKYSGEEVLEISIDIDGIAIYKEDKRLVVTNTKDVLFKTAFAELSNYINNKKPTTKENTITL